MKDNAEQARIIREETNKCFEKIEKKSKKEILAFFHEIIWSIKWAELMKEEDKTFDDKNITNSVAFENINRTLGRFLNEEKDILL